MGPPSSRTIHSCAASVDEHFEPDIAEEYSERIARDNTVAAHAHQFKKVLQLSDVIIQVLDARDPMGCRSRLVEDEVRKAAGDKMMVLALNKTGQTVKYAH
jgi:nuclear GTP-binding protein